MHGLLLVPKGALEHHHQVAHQLHLIVHGGHGDHGQRHLRVVHGVIAVQVVSSEGTINRAKVANGVRLLDVCDDLGREPLPHPAHAGGAAESIDRVRPENGCYCLSQGSQGGPDRLLDWQRGRRILRHARGSPKRPTA